MVKGLNQGAKVRTLRRQNERKRSYVWLAHTSIFGLCFMSVCLMKLNCYSLIYSFLVWLWLLLHINSSICLSKDTWGQKSCLWSLTNFSRKSLLPLWMSRCEDRQMSGSMSKLKTCLLIKMDLFHVLNCLHLDN